mmetsp:Transcript_9375/g.27662  ORF Transcript_9375/g.27662 Transcript_9375/m.27662 type:complete len:374 (-) Transcript_9375:302-1423(-)
MRRGTRGCRVCSLSSRSRVAGGAAAGGAGQRRRRAHRQLLPKQRLSPREHVHSRTHWEEHPLNAEAEARVRALLDVVGLVAEPIVDEAGEQAHPHLQHRLLVRPERRAGDAPASAEEDRQLVRPRRADAAAHLCGGALCDRAERLHARRPALLAQAGRLLRGEQAHHEHLEQPVGVVVACRARVAQRCKALSGGGHRPMEDSRARVEEQQPVKELEDLGAGLVDRGHNGQAGHAREVSQHFNGDEGHGRVEAGCDLVAEQQLRQRQQLHRDAQPLALAARDATSLDGGRVAHTRVCHPREAQRRHHSLHPRFARRRGQRVQSQRSGVTQRFPDGQLCEHMVILLDHRHLALEGLIPELVAVANFTRGDEPSAR